MKLKRVSEGDLSENSTVVGGKWASYWVEAFMFMAWVTHQFVTTQRLQIRQGRGGGQLEVKMLLLSHIQLSNQPFSSVDLSHHQTCLREQREFYLRLYLTGNFNTWALAGVLDLSQIHERTSEDDWGANIHLEMFMLIIRIRPLLSFQLCFNAAGGVFFNLFLRSNTSQCTTASRALASTWGLSAAWNQEQKCADRDIQGILSHSVLQMV